MQKITPFLGFIDNAEAAINFYISLFPNSRILSIYRSTGDNPVPAGKVLHAEFELDGQRFMALDGSDPVFGFNNYGYSMFVNCESQAEVDALWTKLIANGGEEGQCRLLRKPSASFITCSDSSHVSARHLS